MELNGLRNGAIVTFVISLAILLGGGYFAKDRVPPIPAKVVCGNQAVMAKEDILRGQDVYQRYGLMDHGSVWGHGTLRGMDFSAFTLHKLGEFMRDYYASPDNPKAGAFGALPEDQQTTISAKVVAESRTNRYDPATDVLTLTPAQAFAAGEARAFWVKEMGDGDSHYGFLPQTVRTEEQRQDLSSFFFWTAWAAGTDRPGATYTYTNNWPPDRSMGNTPPAQAFIWSILSILSLLSVLGIVIYVVHRYGFFYGEAKGVQASYRLLEIPLTSSQLATAKFFLVAGLLFVIQIFNGGLLAHYTVHPGSFYIPFIGKFYSYSWAKSWHLQLAIFWIATSWVGTAIFVAPLIAGREPKGQRALVNILFAALVLVVGGSLLGEVLGVKGYLGNLWFWLGHQGWEFLELGRLWQILLFGGLLYWLVIVYRVLAPALKDKSSDEYTRSLIVFYVFSAAFVVLFFGFGLVYGHHTHLTIADYWRWFVVHIWVESIFEFFGVAVTSLFLVTLGLVTAKSALRVSYLTAILVFISGIPGTGHHYFWYGGPSMWLAVGSVFSSLEPIPLILLVVRAWMEYASIRAEGRQFPYRWPLYFLTASSVWNFIGAGMFGFVINLPIINYYEHATYLTTNHGHTALFGVYGMLAIALILFSWRSLVRNEDWKDGLLKLSFWGLNGGLFLMFSTSLLPVGLLQTWHSYTDGFWMARSAAFYEMPLVKLFGTWRMAPDTIIIVLGAFPLLYFLITTFLRLRTAGEKQTGSNP